MKFCGGGYSDSEEIEVSFCLPVFNVAAYLQECIDSIVAVDLNVINYEIVCVDDCSTDDSARVLEQIKKGNPQMRILRNESNRGVSYSRNRLIREANGKYIWFIDPDDVLNASAVMPMLQYVKESNADVLLGNYQRFIDGNPIPEISVGNLNFERSDDLPTDEQGIKMNVIWAGPIKREYLLNNSLFFNKGMIAQEDTLFYWNMRLSKPNRHKCDAICYYYRIRNTSVMHSKSASRAVAYYKAMREMLETYEGQKVTVPDEFEAELQNKIHHSQENVAYTLACLPDKEFVKAELKELKINAVYPYAFRKEALSAPRRNTLLKLLTFLLPMEPAFWLLHYVYNKKYNLK